MREKPFGRQLHNRRTRASAKKTMLRRGDDPLQQLQRSLAAIRKTLSVLELQTESQREKIETIVSSHARVSSRFIQLCGHMARVRSRAYHDQLTGLPNRHLFIDRFNQALLRAARSQRRLALLFIDLDGFKAINDHLGHLAGDQLLSQVAHRLVRCLRSEDTAYRYGGDEFLVILPEVDHPGGAATVAEKIGIALARPYSIDEASVGITASIGCAVYPDDGRNMAELIRTADNAMYQRKRARNGSRDGARSDSRNDSRSDSRSDPRAEKEG